MYLVWFMPKRRTQKFAFVVVKERAVRYYSIKNMPDGKVYYGNNLTDVLICIPHLV